MRQLKISNKITSRESIALEKYLSDIGKIDLLTPEDEASLAAKIREGDALALERLTKANLRFVVSVAKQYQNQGLSLADLINEGNVGLIKAAKRFDETRGFKFISYAVWWIRQSIMQAIVEYSRLVRMPNNKAAGYTKVTKAIASFQQEFERDPEPEELADLLQVSLADAPCAAASATSLLMPPWPETIPTSPCSIPSTPAGKPTPTKRSCRNPCPRRSPPTSICSPPGSAPCWPATSASTVKNSSTSKRSATASTSPASGYGRSRNGPFAGCGGRVTSICLRVIWGRSMVR